MLNETGWYNIGYAKLYQKPVALLNWSELYLYQWNELLIAVDKTYVTDCYVQVSNRFLIKIIGGYKKSAVIFVSNS